MNLSWKILNYVRVSSSRVTINSGQRCVDYTLITRKNLCPTLHHLLLDERRSGTVSVMINQLLLQQVILG